MSIVRIKKDRPGYTMIRNEPLNDGRLSWAARGLLAHLLSKPDNWEVSVANLINETTRAGKRATGRDGVRAIINELIDAGYIVRQQRERSAVGQVCGLDYVVYELPSMRSVDNSMQNSTQPETAKPAPAETPLQINEVNKGRRKTPSMAYAIEAPSCGKSALGEPDALPEPWYPAINTHAADHCREIGVDPHGAWEAFCDQMALNGRETLLNNPFGRKTTVAFKGWAERNGDALRPPVI